MMLWSLPLLSNAEGVTVLSAGEVMNRIHLEDSSAVIWSLSKDPSAWRTVIGGIRSGVPEWLSIGEELSFSSPAALTEEVTEAIQQALDVNPAGVLRLHKNPLEEICGGGDIDMSDISIDQKRRKAQRRLHKILRIKEQDISQATIKNCAKSLRAYLKTIPR